MGELEGSSSSWREYKERRLKEGYQEGPEVGDPMVKIQPETHLKTEEQNIAENLTSIEGYVTEKPFSERKIRNRQWYTNYSLRALSLLQFHRSGKKIALNFPNTSLQNLIPAIETISKLPFLIHEKLGTDAKISSIKYDKTAKEILASKNVDIWGKEGVFQAILAYWRAYKKLGSVEKQSPQTSLTLKIRKTQRSNTKTSKHPKQTPKPTFTNKDLEDYDPFRDLKPGTIKIERSDRSRR